MSHTFGTQSAAWLSGLEIRRRRPISSATLSTYGSHIRRLRPIVGADTELSSINNSFLRDLANKLSGSPKTVTELLMTVKVVVASAVNEETGDPLYPRTWNHVFIDAPTIEKQKQPTLSAEQVDAAIKGAESYQEKLLYAVLSGGGVRISEALAIRVGPVDEGQTSFLAGVSVIKVRASIFRGKERRGVLKTASARRDVDLDPRLSAAITKFVEASGIQPGEFLFQSKGGDLAHLQTLTAWLKRRGIPGFHAFRRFRTTRLREIGVSEDIIRYWLGHAGQSITDRYSKLAESKELRSQWAVRAGLGFDLDKVGHPAPRITKATKQPVAAKPKPWLAPNRTLQAAKAAEQKRLAALEPQQQQQHQPPPPPEQNAQ